MVERPQITKIALVVVLAGVLGIVLLLQSGLLPTGSKSGKHDASAGKAVKSVTSASDTAETSAQRSTVWSRPDPVGPIGRDPTQTDKSLAIVSPNVTSAAAAPGSVEAEYTIAGIMYSTAQPSSILIDGHVLHEGDTIYNAVIVKIAEDSAELRRGDKSWVVKPGEQYRGSDIIRSQK
jgi:hypothetical protein